VATTVMGAEGEGQTTTPPDEGTQTDPPEGGSAVLSVEEVEAQWKHRVSQKDKAHAAAEQALREENDRLKLQLASRAPSGGQSGNGDAGDSYLRDQLAQAQRETEEERRLRSIEAKARKYPALAAQVGDSGTGIFATADDATLAKLNALADDDASSGGSTFAPTTPRKPAPAAPKSLNDMSKQELEAELKKSVERGGHLPR
jgi:hypothetical protein